jgi:3'-phosphoadenosine 5'-phosphosulfate sulfotransferase (PAPS reductase)/FAD synthetase
LYERFYKLLEAIWELQDEEWNRINKEDFSRYGCMVCGRIIFPIRWYRYEDDTPNGVNYTVSVCNECYIDLRLIRDDLKHEFWRTCRRLMVRKGANVGS